MTLLAPLTTALIGILGGVTLLLIYALRSRRRMVKVSSIRHWPPVADDTQASEPFRWPRPSWLLLIQFLILGSLAIAAGRPTVTGSDGGADTVLVIDCSASMAALGDDGVTRFDAARAVALREAERAMRGGGRVALIRADAAPQLVTGFTQSGAALRAVLGDLQQTDEAQDLATVPAILDGLLAGYESRSEGSERRPRRVLLIDDRAGVDPRLAGYQIEHRRIGGETTPRNVGIVKLAASRAADVPGAVRLLLEFVATRDAESAVVVLSLDGAEVERFPVSFGADRVARRVMTVAATEGVLTVSLQGGDALAADDSASLVIVPERRLTVGLVRRSGPMVEGSATDWLLEETLRALPRADVKVVRIGAVSGLIGTLAEAGVDVVVSDGVLIPGGVVTPTLVFGGGSGEVAGGPSGGVRQREAVMLWNRDDPILAGLSLDGVFGLAGTAEPAGAKVMARSLARPLVWRSGGADGEVRRIGVAFSTGDTNWPLDVSFPVFVSRSVDWLAGVDSGEAARSFKAGAVTSMGGGGPVRMRRAGVFGGAVGATPEGSELLAVNVSDRGESALEAAQGFTASDRVDARGGEVTSQREVWWWFLAAAAALLVVEWVVFGVGARVGK